MAGASGARAGGAACDVRNTPATGRSRERSARNEPDFVRRARDVTGTLTVTEPKRRAVACSAQVCARRGTTPRNHGPAPPSRRTPESRWTQAHTCKLSHRGASEAADREFVVWSSTRLTLGQALSLLKHLVVIHSC